MTRVGVGDLGEAVAGVVGADRLHLQADRLARRRQRCRPSREGGEAALLGAEAGGEVDLPHRPEDLLAVAGGHRRRPASARSLGSISCEPSGRRSRCSRGSASAAARGGRGPAPGRSSRPSRCRRTWALSISSASSRPAVSAAMSAIVNGARRPAPRAPCRGCRRRCTSKLSLEQRENGSPPGQVGGAHPLDQQQRLALAGALVVQLRPGQLDLRHRAMLRERPAGGREDGEGDARR